MMLVVPVIQLIQVVQVVRGIQLIQMVWGIQLIEVGGRSDPGVLENPAD